MEKGEACLRTSFWHLWMKLKNIYLKNFWNRSINEITFIFTMLHFLKKKNLKKAPGDITVLHLYQKSWWYYLQFLRYRTWKTEIVIFRLFFALLSPKNPGNPNFEKNRKFLETSSFYTCTKNRNHMMYGSLDAEWDRQNF